MGNCWITLSLRCLLFYILTICRAVCAAGEEANEPRPYKAFGYPVLPALCTFVMAAWNLYRLLRYKPHIWPIDYCVAWYSRLLVLVFAKNNSLAELE